MLSRFVAILIFCMLATCRTVPMPSPAPKAAADKKSSPKIIIVYPANMYRCDTEGAQRIERRWPRDGHYAWRELYECIDGAWTAVRCMRANPCAKEGMICNENPTALPLECAPDEHGALIWMK